MNQPQTERINPELVKSIKAFVIEAIDHLLENRLETAIALEELVAEIRQRNAEEGGSSQQR